MNKNQLSNSKSVVIMSNREFKRFVMKTMKKRVKDTYAHLVPGVTLVDRNTAYDAEVIAEFNDADVIYPYAEVSMYKFTRGKLVGVLIRWDGVTETYVNIGALPNVLYIIKFDPSNAIVR